MIGARMRSELRVIGMPVSGAQAVVTLGASALLFNDRGREPFVDFGGVQYSISPPTTAATLAFGIAATWWGAIVVPLAVAAGWASHLEQDVSTTRRLFEPSRVARLANSFLSVLFVTAIGTAALTVVIVVAAAGLAGGGAPQPLSFNPHLLLAIPTMVTFWWSWSILVATVTRNAVVTAVVPLVLSVASLAMARVGWTAQYLPSTWLAGLVGVGAHGNSTSSIWADGGGILDVEWATTGASHLPLLAMSAVFMTCVSVLPDV